MSRRSMLSSIHFLVCALCATNIHAQVAEWVPVSSTGPHTINGNEIVLPEGGVRIELEVFLSGWGDAPGNPALGAAQVTGVGTDMLGVNAIPSNPGVDLKFTPDQPCNSDSDCPTGLCGTLQPGICDDSNSRFQRLHVCLDDQSIPCSVGSTCPGTPICLANPDLVFPEFCFFISDFPHPNANVEFSAGCSSFSIADPGVPRYFGSIRMDVPIDAEGVYTITFNPDSERSFMNDGDGVIIPGLTLISATIRLPADCNDNGQPDSQDIAFGISPDCDGNGVLDECEPDGDCNGNGQLDECDIALLTSPDCNMNGVPDECEPDGDCNRTGNLDECDIADGASDDCDTDGVPDECQTDCNGNGIADTCDLAGGSGDCNANGIPDECELQEDCDTNGVQDICDVAAGAPDCNFNEVPDGCEPDEDCNSNGVRDICDIGAGTEDDCNANNIPDACDLLAGSSPDDNGNGVPDECDVLAPAVAFSPHDRPKNRFISFVPNNPDPVAIKVEWIQRQCVETGWDCFVGDDCAPGELCKELGTVHLGWLAEPIDASTLPFSGAPVETFTSHVVAEPTLIDWTAFDVVHIGDCEIAPLHRYALKATIDPTGSVFSEPLFLQTTGKAEFKFWGDVAGAWNGTEWTPPNGLVNVNDWVAWIFAFKSKPAPHITAVEMAPEVPNFITNVTDLTMIIQQGFQGKRYPPPSFANQGTVADCP